MTPTRKCPVCKKVKKATSFCTGNICKRCNAATGRIVLPHIEDDKILFEARQDILAGVLIRAGNKETARGNVALGEVGASEIVYKLGVWLAKNKSN